MEICGATDYGALDATKMVTVRLRRCSDEADGGGRPRCMVRHLFPNSSYSFCFLPFCYFSSSSVFFSPQQREWGGRLLAESNDGAGFKMRFGIGERWWLWDDERKEG
eukprot:TRINITY_DN17669_c0_g1_i2.p1 TRINITY_DN17669_c0_g1~~TRINITY_DN17669_c0_g1_i2.p1  ORF type:complete len:107 (-),score=19.38 TRINITY_DN17669_c0_g1_i2:226-546(-)